MPLFLFAISEVSKEAHFPIVTKKTRVVQQLKKHPTDKEFRKKNQQLEKKKHVLL